MKKGLCIKVCVLKHLNKMGRLKGRISPSKRMLEPWVFILGFQISYGGRPSLQPPTWLIGCQPKCWKFKTPLNVFKEYYPTCRFFYDITSKVFGCIDISMISKAGNLIQKQKKKVFLLVIQWIKKGKTVLIRSQKNCFHPWM